MIVDVHAHPCKVLMPVNSSLTESPFAPAEAMRHPVEGMMSPIPTELDVYTNATPRQQKK